MIKKLIPALMISALLCSCSDGNSFAVAKVDLDMTFASETGTGNVHITENGDKIQLTSLEFEIESIEIAIVTNSTGSNNVEFDPSNPPAPYTNCHNGHCHSTESSNIYTFDEIIAELSGGSTNTSSITLDLDKEITFTSFNTAQELGDLEIPLDIGNYQKLIVNVGHVSLTAKNLTTGETIQLSNLHDHDDDDDDDHHHDGDDHDHEHAHVHGFSVSHPIELNITKNSEYEHELGFDLEINAHFLDELSENNDFADLVKAHVVLEPEDEDHEHEHHHD